MLKVIGDCELYRGDCLEVMKQIPDKSIDMILCDLPYGTTVCKWDCIIPFDKLWKQYERLSKHNATIALTGAMPFTAKLCVSNLKLFRYSLVWNKVNKYTGALNANKMPLRIHEDILIFYKSLPIYNKQYRTGKAFNSSKTGGHGNHTNYGNLNEYRECVNDGKHHNPCSILNIHGDVKKELNLHPTQKPVALFEYLIKTYTNEGGLVLDNCMGSGTTGVACQNTNRKFIGIEKEKEYFNVAYRRIKDNA